MPTPVIPLMQFLVGGPDFRAASGKRHPLSAILALACAASLCGYRSYGAMAEWGRNYGATLVAALGFTRATTPCAATLHTVFKNLDGACFEAKLGAWAAQALAALPGAAEQLEAVACDGKTLRGSRKLGASGSHLLAAVSQRLGLTLTQCAVADKTNELSAMPDILAGLLPTGRVITTDALHTQREFAQAVLDAGGDYLMLVKDNQPQLREDIATLFQEPQVVAETLTTARTCDPGHGRIEERCLTASWALLGYTDWPGLQQVFQLERTITIKKTGQQRHEVVYGVTSLSPQRADATRLLRCSRGHWRVEAGHWIRDVTFDEDRSQVRCGHIPQVMAALRNTAIALHAHGWRDQHCRGRTRYAAQPWAALALIGIACKN